MSAFNLNSIFVCSLCIFFIYVDGTPLNYHSKQSQSSKESTNLPLAYRISEIIYEVTALNDFRTEKMITEKPLCESLLATLNDSQGFETFRSTMAEIQNLISNHNHDTQRIIINSILTTLDSCLKQASGKDFRSFQTELTNMIFGNYKIPLDSNTSENFDVSVNFSNDFSADVDPKYIFEQRSGHEFAPRDLDNVLWNGPTVEFGPEESLKKSIRRTNGNTDGIFVSSKHERNESSKRSAINIVRNGRRFFSNDDELAKFANYEDLRRTTFLNKNKRGGKDSTQSNEDTKVKIQKKNVFDDNLLQMFNNDKSKSDDKFSTNFDFNY